MSAAHRRLTLADRLIARIRRLPRADQQALLSYTLARPRITPPIPYRWVPERTLVNIICHAVGVKTVTSPEEERLRAEIHASLANGEPLDYFRRITPSHVCMVDVEEIASTP